MGNAELPVSVVFEPVPKVHNDRNDPAADGLEEGCERREADLGNSAELDRVSIDVDLTQPLGIFFDEALLAQEVQPGSQAFQLGVRSGWRLCSIAGEQVDKTDEFIAVVTTLKDQAVPSVDVAFKPAPLVVKFEERPFGFSFAFNEALARFTVGAVSPAAEAKGIVSGMAVCTVSGQQVAGLQQDAVVDILKNAALPATVVFVAMGAREEILGE